MGCRFIFVVGQARRLHNERAWCHLAETRHELHLLPLRAYVHVMRERGRAVQNQVTPTDVGVGLATSGKVFAHQQAVANEAPVNHGSRQGWRAASRHCPVRSSAHGTRRAGASPCERPPVVVRQRPFVVVPLRALCSARGNTRLQRGRHVG